MALIGRYGGADSATRSTVLPIEIRPDARAFLEALNTTPLARMEALQPAEARRLRQQVRGAKALSPPHGLAVVRDLSFTHEGVEIGLRSYDAKETREPGPIIVYFHGGGFVFGDLESHHALCITLARESGLPVLAVDYRLAPEHPWPAAPEDAEAAARWVAEHAMDVLGREATSLVLGGDSSGANLAAVTARALRDRPSALPVAAQYLLYPCVARNVETASRADFAENLFLTKAAIAWFFEHYAPADDDPRFDLRVASAEGMPPTLIATAGLDPLRDEDRDYAASLIRAGVPVVYQEAVGNIHGCFSMVETIPSTAEDLSASIRGLLLLLSLQDARGKVETTTFPS